MGKENELSTCISGSFKFKPEIDRLIEEFQDLHVKVLSPEKGWLFLPIYQIVKPKFRPLPHERRMSIKQIEDSFLRNLAHSNFLYVASFSGYTGESTNLEIGFAYGRNVPIYAVEKINNPKNDLWAEEFLRNNVKVMTPEETVKDVREQIENSSERS